MDLLADVGRISYDWAVSNEEMWSAAGQELRRRREAAGFSSTIALALAIGDQHAQKTFDKVERGQVGHVKSVHRYCAAVGATLADVLRSILPTAALSSRAVQVGTAYDQLPQVQPLVDLALQLPARAVDRDRPQGEPVDDLRQSSVASRGPRRTVRGRR